MEHIKLLDKAVAELVAAGEVVERPASVIKELTENCVDAGATSITVEIERGGLGFMRVTDNGCGIAPDEVEVAFMRHATSKIRSANDLAAIGTLGFRGEALASICAVSRTEIMTKKKENTLGCRAVIEGGEFKDIYETGCPDGTTILIRDLFYNVPARLKFMKTDTGEGNAVTAAVQRIALAHPEIAVRFLRGGKEILYTPGNGRLFSAIYAVMGKEFAADLVQTDYTMNGISVSGYVTKPYAAQGSRNSQVFILNGRYVKSKTCMAAVEQACRNTVAVGRFPGCVLSVRMPLDAVDVNIHPAKTEVRFVSESAVFDAVYFAVKSALTSKTAPTVPGFGRAAFDKLSESPQPDEKLPLPTAQPVELPSSPAPEPPVAPLPEIVPPSPYLPKIDFPEAAVPPPKRERAEDIPTAAEMSAEVISAEGMRLAGEVFSTYIIVECGGKMYMIDKHAAHERIIFERLKEKVGNIGGQLLLQPISVALPPAEHTAVIENLSTLSDMGFCVEDFGERVMLREAPEYIDASQAEALLRELAEQLTVSHGRVAADILDDLLHTAACKAAIKGGQKNGEAELLEVARTVLTDPRIRYCPHGRPVLVTMSRYELDKRFGRV